MTKKKRQRPIDRIIKNQEKKWDYVQRTIEDRQRKQDSLIHDIRNETQKSKQQTRRDLAALALLTKDYEMETHGQAEGDWFHRYPFDWAPGTVRGHIALVITYLFAFVSMCDLIPTLLHGYPLYIPIQWYCGIWLAVIGSYFVTRLKVK
jgi:hypothetical protein